MGGTTLFDSFEGALAFILSAGKYGRRKEALKAQDSK